MLQSPNASDSREARTPASHLTMAAASASSTGGPLVIQAEEQMSLVSQLWAGRPCGIRGFDEPWVLHDNASRLLQPAQYAH